MRHRKSHTFARAATLTLFALIAACGGGGGDTPPPTQSQPATTYTLGGTLSGLGNGKSLVLRNNGADALTLSASGAFAFSTRLVQAAGYEVTVGAQPAGQHCSITNARAAVGSANVTNIQVACVDSGVLDTSFGPAQTGIVSHNGSAGGNSEWGNAMTIDSAGRTVIAGTSRNSGFTYEMALWRYKADGTLDTSFNSTGYTTHTGGGLRRAEATAVAIDSSGRILVCGYSQDNYGNGLVIWRYTAEGQLDTSFNGGTGYLRYAGEFPGGSGMSTWATGLGMTLDAKGRIVVAGYILPPGLVNTNWDTAVWRYNADGTPDTSFNGTGRFSQNFSVESNDQQGADIATAVTVDSAGRVLLVGYSNVNPSAANREMTLIRLTEAGALDTNFNSTGIVRHVSATGGNFQGTAVATDVNNRVVVTGSSAHASDNAIADATVWRFNTNGSPDTSFNGSGYVAHNGAAGGNGDDSASALAFDAEGHILIGGYSANAANVQNMTVWRYNTNGTPDTNFAASGIFVFASTASSSLRGLRIDAAGRLVAAGQGKNASATFDVMSWRITP
jgi:uncharacterized delta-60 repeat protein